MMGVPPHWADAAATSASYGLCAFGFGVTCALPPPPVYGANAVGPVPSTPPPVKSPHVSGKNPPSFFSSTALFPAIVCAVARDEASSAPTVERGGVTGVQSAACPFARFAGTQLGACCEP